LRRRQNVSRIKCLWWQRKRGGMSPARLDPNANILPAISTIREVALHVAAAVAREAVASGFAGFSPVEELEDYLRKIMWQPEYVPYVRKGVKYVHDATSK